MQQVLSWRYFSLPSCVKRQPSWGKWRYPNPSLHIREEHFRSPSGSISTPFTRPERGSTLHNHPQDPWRVTQYKFAAEGGTHAGPPGLTPEQKQQESLNRKEASHKPGMRQHMRPRLWGQVRYLTSLTGETQLLPGGDRTQVTRWHGDSTQQSTAHAGWTMGSGGRWWQAAIRTGVAPEPAKRNLSKERLRLKSHLEGCSVAHSAGRQEQRMRYS